jgi:AcrR family transcriptional regulator
VPARPSTREALLDAAEELLARGEIDAPVATIAAEAGVAVGSFYNHFDSKESLFTEAARRAFASFEAELVALTEHITSPAELLCTRIRLYCRIPDTHPQLARIVVNAAPRSLISPTGYSPSVAADAERAASRGELEGAGLPVKLMLIAAGAERLVGQSIVFDLPCEQRADDFVAVAMEILGIPRTRARRMAHRPLAALLKR